MVELSRMIIPFTLILFTINSLFLFMGQLPATQSGDQMLDMGMSEEEKNNLNTQIIQFYGDKNSLLPPDINNITASTTQQNYLDIFKDWLLGVPGVGLALTLIKYVSGIAFGYWSWIDFFINPSWGPIAVYIALPIKFFFFIIQLYGMFIMTQTLFSIGTGYRTQL